MSSSAPWSVCRVGVGHSAHIDCNRDFILSMDDDIDQLIDGTLTLIQFNMYYK